MQRLLSSPLATSERLVSLSPIPRSPLRPKTWAASSPLNAHRITTTTTTIRTSRRAELCKASAENREGDSELTPSAAAAGSASSAGVSSLSELPEYPADFLRRRWITFLGIVLGYSCFYLTRNSLTYTAPAMVADKMLGLSMTDVSNDILKNKVYNHHHRCFYVCISLFLLYLFGSSSKGSSLFTFLILTIQTFPLKCPTDRCSYFYFPYHVRNL
jgi:hypothetical protein